MVSVSVIVPVYNVEKYLEECLDSIVNQTLKDIEIICINDGSTDNSLSILENYAKKDDRIKIHNQENGGLSVSRNHGIKLSQGEYIYFIDSDDYLELNALEELYNFSKAKNLDILIFKLINFNDVTYEHYTSNYYEMSFLKPFNRKVFNYDSMGEKILNVAVSAPGKFFSRSLIYTMKFPEGLIFEDNLFFSEAMIKAKRVSFLDEHFYHRRIREDSITTTKTIKFADSIIIVNRIIDLTKEFKVYDKFKRRLMEKKIYSAYNRFSQVDEVYKEEFFHLIKEDFKKHEKEYKNDYIFIKKVNSKPRYIFNTALECDNYKDFELKVKIYSETARYKALRRKKRLLNKDYKRIKNLNDQLLTSNSWKVTKPLRKILGGFRND